ncbi:ubiquinone biosynthesis O-methyltransferase, mitochondrial-like [Photinus pyralis]|uniref:ubiquinone biosynthesis O-methyltransferase, mitochondrial-like n=1 Tax=Photinus pyralis TaxID=7054 RepID=UPI00126759D9|nr:ubiquinone biosynthesis O-methyltransferase, mitochondrial-like [Photinus pyralis]
MFVNTRRVIQKCYKKGVASFIRVMYSKKSTIIESQVNHFNQLQEQWWNKNGAAKPLHSLNKLRVPFVWDGLVNSGVVHKNLLLKQNPDLLANIEILDAGCGGGILAEALMRSGGTVTGIDPSKELIEIAKNHNVSRNINYYSVTIEEFSIENKGKFDAVITSEVIEHVCELEVFLESCISCLKPGGSLFITTINQTLLAWFHVIVLSEILFRQIPLGTHQYRNIVPYQRLLTILENNKCRIGTGRGMVYNFLNNDWYWIKTTATHYAVHAIKN